MSKLTDALKVIQDYKEIKDVVDLIIPEVYPYVERLSDGIVDLKIRSIRRYENEGFTREESILLTLDTQHSLMNNARNN